MDGWRERGWGRLTDRRNVGEGSGCAQHKDKRREPSLIRRLKRTSTIKNDNGRMKNSWTDEREMYSNSKGNEVW